MIEIAYSTLKKEPLATVLLKADREAREKSASLSQKNLGKQDFADLEENRIEIEKPLFWDLSEFHASDLTGDHQVWLIQLGISLAPAIRNVIEWSRLKVLLQVNGPQPDMELDILHFFPYSRYKFDREKLFITNKLEFRQSETPDPEILVDIQLPLIQDTEMSGIKKEKSLLWDIRADQIYGNIPAYLLVRKSREATLSAEFAFHAKVTSSSGVEIPAYADFPTMGGASFVFGNE